MTDKMTEQDKEIEEILRAYRPVGPPERLRSRVLSPAVSDTKPIRLWRVWSFRAAVAAVPDRGADQPGHLRHPDRLGTTAGEGGAGAGRLHYVELRR